MTEPVDLETFLGQSKPTMRQRLVKWGGIAIGVILLLLLLARCFAPAKPMAYATTPIARGDLNVTISATGNLAPTKQVNVGSEASGLIDRVNVQNNDKVTKGQPLASLDLSRLKDALIQSRAALQAAIATVAQNKATVQQTRAKLARYEQVFKLSDGKVPSQTELDIARGDYARAIANVAAAEAQVAQSRANVSTNETNLAKGTIYAPVTGVVLSRQIEPGQTVAAQFNVATLFTIAGDLSSMKLEVKVDEADVGELREGAPAIFTVDAYPGRTFPARVTRVDLGANATPQVNSAGTTVAATSTVIAYTAVLAVSNPDLLLKPGMTATATITAAHKANVLLVPNAALRFNPTAAAGAPQRGIQMGNAIKRANNGSQTADVGRGSRQQVWTVGADGKPMAIPITTGDTDGSMTEVSGGKLRPGMKVITGQLTAAAAQ
jgi:HlyD family secretion protein